MEMRLLSAALEDEIEAAQSETLELIKTLCRIPAPSHREERRAAFIREWLEARIFRRNRRRKKRAMRLGRGGKRRNRRRDGAYRHGVP